MMNPEIVTAMRQVRRMMGEDILRDERRVAALLADLLGNQYSGERRLLKELVTIGIPRMIADGQVTAGDLAAKAAFVAQKYLWNEEATLEALCMWYATLRPEMPTPRPPKPTPQPVRPAVSGPQPGPAPTPRPQPVASPKSGSGFSAFVVIVLFFMGIGLLVNDNSRAWLSDLWQRMNGIPDARHQQTTREAATPSSAYEAPRKQPQPAPPITQGAKILETTVVEKKQSRKRKNEWGKECSIKVQYPTDTSNNITRTISEFINEQLGSSYNGNIFDINEMTSYYINECLKPGEHDKDMPSDWPSAEYKIEIVKLFETDTYVTYEVSIDGYGGGAHGFHVYDGMTFRKSDGRRMTWDALTKIHSLGFNNIIKKGLKESFNVKSDDDLAGYLMLSENNDVSSLPLPKSSPLFTKDGMKFTYGEYEISCYGAGTPQFVVPYSELTPYLTPAAREMVNQ